MNFKVSIADIIISFEIDYLPFNNKMKEILKKFITESSEYDIQVKLNKVDNYEIINDRWDYSITSIKNNIMKIKKWDIYGKIDFIKNTASFKVHKDSDNFFLILKTILLNFLPKFNGLLLHSSSVAISNYGIIGSGISGSGKSTFAKKLESEGCTIIHDEITLIRKINNKFNIYSTPFNYNPKHIVNYLPEKELKKIFFLKRKSNYYSGNIDKKNFYKEILKLIFGYNQTNKYTYNLILNILNELYDNITIKELSFNLNDSLMDKIL